MKKTWIKAAALAVGGMLTLASGGAVAEDARTLSELLRLVEQGRLAEQREHREREQRFLANRDQQQQLLRDAQNELARQERRSEELEGKFSENERLISDLRSQRRERMGALTELFGHLTATTGDLRSVVTESLTSAQFPNRERFLDELIAKMSGMERLPSIEDIERLWFELQREMTEGGRVVAFDSRVTRPGGEREDARVVRIGTYNIVSDQGRYLQYVSTTGNLVELARQPSGPYQRWAARLADLDSGMTSFGVDPTGPRGGSYLAALIDSPTLTERWHQGGIIGYIITGVGVVAVLIALWRLVTLSVVGSKVNAQLKSETASNDNPLGRVLMVHEKNPNMDTETLELKLNEAVLKEVPRLEFAHNLLKIIAAVAPLMGLLGTVTGMIITFQAITIFGAGDPQAMAGGISSALVTTVLGLIVAIPTVLLHTWVNGRAKRIIHLLEEQSSGIIAEHNEAQLGKG